MVETNSSTATAAPPATDRTLASTVGKGAFFGIVSTAAQVGTRLISVPIVIHYLGLGGYGIWSIIMVTAAYMRFGSVGIKCAFQKYVAEATGNGDFDKANRLVSTGAIAMLVLSALGLIPVAIFSQRVAAATGVSGEFLPATAAAFQVLACIYVISNFGAAYEAIVMGGHRIDLTRKCNTVLTVCEAGATILVLHWGFGLYAMALVMCASELVYIVFCYLASRRVLPQMSVRWKYFTASTFPELIRFAGSYQLGNVLEVVYIAILPVVILKTIGAEAAGIFAVASRVVASALIAQDALALPILSAGTMIFASGKTEQARQLVAQFFKVTLATSVLPLALVSAFGSTVVFAWTGDANPAFETALGLIALAGLFKALSLLQLILYRATGRALCDNIGQVLRIAVILAVSLGARKLGFAGLLAGYAVAEMARVIFMFFAMAATLHVFNAKRVAEDALRISAATAIVAGAGALMGLLPVSLGAAARVDALFKLGAIGVGCLLGAWPAIALTNALSPAERRTFLDAVIARKKRLLG